MNKRNLILLAGAVAVLLVVSIVQNTSHRRRVRASDTRPVLAVDFQQDDVNRVAIAYGADTTGVVLERLPDKWVVRSAWSHPADKKKIVDLLQELQDLRGEFRSSDASVLPDYGFTDSTAVRITVFGKEWQPLFTLEVGNRPKRGGGAFVRLKDDPTVYLTRANVLGRLGLYSGPDRPKNRYFLDLQVWKADRLDVDALTIVDGDTTLRLEKVFPQRKAAPADSTGADSTAAAKETGPDRNTWEWVLVEGDHRTPLAKTKCDAVLNAAVNIQAADIADPDAPLEEYGLWKAPRHFKVTLHDGTEFEMRFGKKRENEKDRPGGTYMMTSRDRTVWVVRDYKVNQLFKAKKDLLPES